MFAVMIGFSCGAITGVIAMVIFAMNSKSSDCTLDLLNDVLSEENDSLVMKCQQLSQSVIETSQALRQTQEELATYKNGY